MTRKLTLEFDGPHKIRRKVAEVEIKADLSNWPEIVSITDRWAPRGDKSSLERALSILPPLDRKNAEPKIEKAVILLLMGESDRKHPMSHQRSKLLDVETAASLLEARLHQLGPRMQQAIQKRLKASARVWRDDSPHLTRTLNILRDIAHVASVERDKTPAQPGRPPINDAKLYFVKQMISLFAKSKGAEAVTATVPDTHDMGASCYAFVDGVYNFATGKDMQMKQEFKRLVLAFRSRSPSGPRAR